MAGQMRHLDMGKDQEAAVVEHPHPVFPARLGVPTDPVITHRQRARRARQQQAAQALLAGRDEVAQPVAEGALVAQRMPAGDSGIPLRHRRGVGAHRRQAHRAERGQGTLKRCRRVQHRHRGRRTRAPRDLQRGQRH